MSVDHQLTQEAQPQSQTSRKKVAIYGATGRMGRRVIETLRDHPHLKCSLQLNRSSDLRSRALQEQLLASDVLIDFSTQDAQRALFSILNQRSKSAPFTLPLVSGVTGLHSTDEESMRHYSKVAPVFYAPNFSLGVALLKKFTEEASAFLGHAFDIEMYELHHRQKRDAPCGTDLDIAQAASKGRDRCIEDPLKGAPSRANILRDPHEVHVSAGRGGQVIGDHFVYFLGETERLEFVHRAQSRDVFAHGAVRAAEWVSSRAPGWYTMDDLWIP